MRRLAPFALLTLTLLAGCGQKGPLYLPDNEAAAERYGPRDAQQDDAHQNDDARADEPRGADEED
jgi:predicted small lipoprotein YifL